jgi:Kdo2-lipid IVA lauroyltransferase/acyltransferase
MGRGFESLLRHHMSYLVIRVLSVLPLSWLYVVMGAIAGTLRLIGWRRELVAQHLERCLPEANPAQRRQITRDFYRYLGELSAEIGYATSISREALQERVRLENPEVVADALRAGQRVLILSAHHCNWEWLLLRCSVSFDAPLTAAYKRMRNPQTDQAVRALREQFGGTMIPAKQLVQHLLRQRGQVRLLAMLADQSPPVINEQQSWLEFFGQQTAFYNGPGWIGAKMGYTAVLATMQREGRGYYSVRFVELAPPGKRLDSDQILRTYVHELESHVRAYPGQYFWAYNRWKREKPLYG